MRPPSRPERSLDRETRRDDRRWPIAIAIALVIVVLMNLVFIFVAVSGADDVVPSYDTEER